MMAFVYDLTRLTDKKALLAFLEVDEPSFDAAANFDPEAPTTEIVPPYYRHDIPKRNPARGFRTVWEVTELQYTYKALSRRLDSFFRKVISGYPHARSFGYVRGKNIAENAACHTGHRLLITTDIRGFFPSISAERVLRLFEAAGVPPAASEPLSRFLTIAGTLPLGLASSPTIANAICVSLDDELQALAAANGATYSRYADDLTFSSDQQLPDENSIRSIVERHDFELETSKTRISKLGQAHYVTGLSISDPLRPHVPKLTKRRLRQELYYATKYTLGGHLKRLGATDVASQQRELNRLDGMVSFVAHHEPNLAPLLKSRWKAILQLDGGAPSFPPKNQRGGPLVLVFDEAEFNWTTRKCLALGVSSSQQQETINEATNDVREVVVSDLWADGKPEAIKKKGVHFADATEDLKGRYVELMQRLPFQGYVALGTLASSDVYEETYLRLLRCIIRRRLMAADGREALLLFEQNDKVRRAEIRAVVQEAMDTLCSQDNRRPTSIVVDFKAKPDPSLSPPDFLLGVLARYLASGPDTVQSPTPRSKLMFERLRDKYRTITDCDAAIEYSRRRPITP